ncbi:MAG: DMT family transporter [Candidatus Limnocylindrales bacterium]
MDSQPAGSLATGPRLGGLAGPQAVGLLLIVVSACAFGSGALFAKPVYAAGLDWRALLYWRFLIAAVASWAWLLAEAGRRQSLRRLSRRQRVVAVALGVLYVGNSSTYFASLETISASLAALIVYIYPVLVAVMALRFGHPLVGRRPWIALVLAVVGVVLAVGGIDASHAPPLGGVALALASAVIYAVWIVLSARLGGERRTPRDPAPPEAMKAVEETDPAPAAALMMTGALTVYAVVGVLGGVPVTPDRVPSAAWFGLIGVGLVSTAVAVQAFYAGARRIGAARAALVSTIEPVYTIVLATLLFGESLTSIQLLGGACVIGAVLLAETGRHSPPSRVVDGAAQVRAGVGWAPSQADPEEMPS